jgi:hypothetical protein
MFGKERDQEIREAAAAAHAAVADEHEGAANRLEQEAEIREMFGDQTGADSLRSVVAYGREHVIKPLRGQ